MTKKAKSVSKTNGRFLSEEDFRLALKLTRNTKGSQGLPENANSVDRAKYDLCSKFVEYMNKNKMTQREMAAKLKVSESRVSEIAHYNIRKITLDKLIELLERLQGPVKLSVA